MDFSRLDLILLSLHILCTLRASFTAKPLRHLRFSQFPIIARYLIAFLYYYIFVVLYIIFYYRYFVAEKLNMPNIYSNIYFNKNMYLEICLQRDRFKYVVI